MLEAVRSLFWAAKSRIRFVPARFGRNVCSGVYRLTCLFEIASKEVFLQGETNKPLQNKINVSLVKHMGSSHDGER